MRLTSRVLRAAALLTAGVVVAVTAVATVVGSGSVSGGSTDAEVIRAASDRLAGTDRYRTAIEVAKVVGGGSLSGLDRLIVVSGESFPDGLAASGLAGFLDSGGRSGRTAILLTRVNSLPASVADAIVESRVPPTHVLIVGGPASVSEEVHAAIATAAGWDGGGANPVIRIAGRDRYETSASIVEYVIAAAGQELPESYRTVLVASGERFPDALAAGTLAYRNGHVLLLSPGAEIAESTAVALERLGAIDAVLIGGVSALSDDVATQVRSVLGGNVTATAIQRISGVDRFETAARIANLFVTLNGAPRQPTLVSGTEFADALTTAPLAGDDRPLLLTSPDQLPTPTSSWLEENRDTIDEVLIVGGVDAISPEVGNKVTETIDPPSPTTSTPRPTPSSTTTTSPPPTTPAAPVITGISAGNAQLSVAFTPGSDGGSAITNYEYSTDDGSTWRLRASGTTSSPLLITTTSDADTVLVNGTTYQVRIRAVNEFGAGTGSGPSSGTPATCAQGGGCDVGDTGPAGGIIFYVHPDGATFACGPTLNLTCRYLETWTSHMLTSLNNRFMRWSGNTDTLVDTSAALGAGYQNTLKAVEQSSAPDYAITLSRLARGGYNDWYLPSQVELNELCKYARQQPTGDTSVICNNSGSVRGGFLTDYYYWSSTEANATEQYIQTLCCGIQAVDRKNQTTLMARPIRAFG